MLEEFVHDSLPTYYAKAIREHELAPIGEPEIDLDELEEGAAAQVHGHRRGPAPPDARAPSSTGGRGRRRRSPRPPTGRRRVRRSAARALRRARRRRAAGPPRATTSWPTCAPPSTARRSPRRPASATWPRSAARSWCPSSTRSSRASARATSSSSTRSSPSGSATAAGPGGHLPVLVKEVKAKKLPAGRRRVRQDGLRVRHHGRAPGGPAQQARRAEGGRVAGACSATWCWPSWWTWSRWTCPSGWSTRRPEHRVENARERIERQGGTLEQALEQQGWDERRFRADARAHATRAIKADLVLEAVARPEEHRGRRRRTSTPSSGARPRPAGRDAKEVRRRSSARVRSRRWPVISSGRKALDFLVESAEVTSDAGRSQTGSESIPAQGGAR